MILLVHVINDINIEQMKQSTCNEWLEYVMNITSYFIANPAEKIIIIIITMLFFAWCVALEHNCSAHAEH